MLGSDEDATWVTLVKKDELERSIERWSVVHWCRSVTILFDRVKSLTELTDH